MYDKVKDIITDILGFVLFGVAIYLWATGKATYIHAIAMMSFGSLFFLVSDSGLASILKSKLGEILDAIAGRIGKKD